MPRYKKDTLDQISSRFLEAFAEEGERGSVLLVAAVVDEYLRRILKKKLVQISGEDDALFNTPLHNLYWKIKFAYRLGLVSERLCRDLDVIRGIRNDFAHGLFDCNFGNKSVKNRVSELKKSLGSVFPKMYKAISEGAKHNKVWAELVKGKKQRGEFAACAILIMTSLHMVLREKKRAIKPADSEWIYL